MHNGEDAIIFFFSVIILQYSFFVHLRKSERLPASCKRAMPAAWSAGYQSARRAVRGSLDPEHVLYMYAWGTCDDPNPSARDKRGAPRQNLINVEVVGQLVVRETGRFLTL
jgi:hypothetical protein